MNDLLVVISDVGVQGPPGPMGPVSEIDGGDPTTTGATDLDLVDGGTP